LADLTFTNNSISGTTASLLDVGAGNTLSLQTTNNGPVAFGNGLVTIGNLAHNGVKCLHVSDAGVISVSSADCGSGSGTPVFDAPAWQVCNPAGCGSESSNGYYHIMNPTGVTFDECGVNLATAPTGSSVIIDIRDASNTSIFGATKLVIPVGSTSTVFQSTFATSPYTAIKGAKFKAVVTQNDSGGTAQFAYIRCRVH
jgi:hypothetical protein